MLKKLSKEKGNLNEGKIEELVQNNIKGGWSSSRGFKNPRIVRVSHSSFGGKDRHSKVCTIKGLRDRRIRLSVPTAIQLYDLQHKLKLPQPSKVIDWLLDVAKLDIDNLPPLPTPPFPTGSARFSPFHQHMMMHTALFPPPPRFPLDASTHTRDVANQEVKAIMKGKWINIDQDYNHNNNYKYSCDHQPSSCFSISQFGNNYNNNNNINGVFNPLISQVIEAPHETSSSSNSFFTPYANSYITNPFENHIHFSNPFQPNFGSQNLKPFPPNLNLNHHGAASGKDATINDV